MARAARLLAAASLACVFAPAPTGLQGRPSEAVGAAEPPPADVRRAALEAIARYRTALAERAYDVLREVLDLGAILDAALAEAPRADGRDPFWRWGASSGLLQGLVDGSDVAGPFTLRALEPEGAPERWRAWVGWWDANGVSRTSVFRLSVAGDRARIVDLWDADDGLSLTGSIGALVLARDGRIRDGQEPLQLSPELGFDEAEAVLARWSARLPAAALTRPWLVLCQRALQREEPAWLLERVEALRRDHPEAALLELYRSQALAALGRTDDALASLDRYDAEIRGPDAFSRLERARLELARGEPERARALAERVLDERPDDLEALLFVAELLPRWEMDVLAARFAAVPDRAATFEPLVGALLDADLLDAAEALCEARLAELPADPDARYWRARLHLLLEELESAATAALAALEVAPTDELAAFQYLWLEAALANGNGAQAWRPCPDRAAALRGLAERYLAWGEHGSLGELLDAYGREVTGDPWAACYRALLWAQGEDAEEGRARLRAGLAATEDAELRERYRFALVELAYLDGEDARACLALAPGEASFAQLLEAGYDDGDAPFVQALVEARLAEVPEDPLRPLYRGLAALVAGQPERAARRLARALPAVLADGRWVLVHEEATARALLACGEADRALALAVEAEERDGDPYLHAVVRAARGEAEAALELLARCVRLGQDPWGFYDDPICGPILLEAEAFEPWRASYPPGFVDPGGEDVPEEEPQGR